ncbi:MAG: hypothetical protein CMO55_09735 [Verrucomicrobiales bacterium]|nr:hypothetical protein [Verrucomicrobiales bacterium]
MFAGPNGSGKSTLNNLLLPHLIGVYVNADVIERTITETGKLCLKQFEIAGHGEELIQFLQHSSFLSSENLTPSSSSVSAERETVLFHSYPVNSYLASVIADFLRKTLMVKRKTLTIETVMSHPSKVDLLKKAQESGYRTYLYFIATEDPLINVSRVKNRVAQGGHPVPEEKIIERYDRSLNLLFDAIRNTNRAYLFDNSGENKQRTWLAEVTEGNEIEFKTDKIPAWFRRYLLEKIS